MTRSSPSALRDLGDDRAEMAPAAEPLALTIFTAAQAETYRAARRRGLSIFDATRAASLT